MKGCSSCKARLQADLARAVLWQPFALCSPQNGQCAVRLLAFPHNM